MKNNSIRNIFIGIVPYVIFALSLCCSNVLAMKPGQAATQLSPDLQKALSDPGVIRALAQFVAMNQSQLLQPSFTQDIGHLSRFTQQRGQLALMERYGKLIEKLEKGDKKEEKNEDSLAVKCAKDIQGNVGKIVGGAAQMVITNLVTWSLILSGLYMLPGGRFVLDGVGKILGLHSFSNPPPPAVTPDKPDVSPVVKKGLFARVGNIMVQGPAYVIRKAVSVL